MRGEGTLGSYEGREGTIGSYERKSEGTIGSYEGRGDGTIGCYQVFKIPPAVLPSLTESELERQLKS